MFGHERLCLYTVWRTKVVPENEGKECNWSFTVGIHLLLSSTVSWVYLTLLAHLVQTTEKDFSKKWAPPWKNTTCATAALEMQLSACDSAGISFHNLFLSRSRSSSSATGCGDAGAPLLCSFPNKPDLSNITVICLLCKHLTLLGNLSSAAKREALIRTLYALNPKLHPKGICCGTKCSLRSHRLLRGTVDISRH